MFLFYYRKSEFGGPNNRDRGMNNYDNGPGMAIDTWTNDVAEEPKKENSFGSKYLVKNKNTVCSSYFIHVKPNDQF